MLNKNTANKCGILMTKQIIFGRLDPIYFDKIEDLS
jgi:hypothetical protein